MDMEVTLFPVKLTGKSAPIKTFLRRLGAQQPGAPAVVLLHGGNTSGDTFLWPQGGLAGFLVERGFDVWILEWRSSPHIVRPLLDSAVLGGAVIEETRLFTLDRVVADEVPAAFDIIRAKIGDAPLSVLGHCLGSAVVSLAIARGALERFHVSRVVLNTLGLFVEVPWNGWIKAEDFIMERVLHDDPACRGVDPQSLAKWPKAMLEGYQHWPPPWLPVDGPNEVGLLRRLSFMFGQPYSINRIHPSLRTPQIAEFFGPMHIGLFLHASQMVRRGYVAEFDAPDIVDRSRQSRAASKHADVRADLDPTYFRNKRITLFAAAENQLWHRDSIDLMYEWLRSSAPEAHPPFCTKRVFAGYNLQELLWGVNAREEVFPHIEAALGVAKARSPTPPVIPPGRRTGVERPASASLTARSATPPRLGK